MLFFSLECFERDKFDENSVAPSRIAILKRNSTKERCTVPNVRVNKLADFSLRHLASSSIHLPNMSILWNKFYRRNDIYYREGNHQVWRIMLIFLLITLFLLNECITVHIRLCFKETYKGLSLSFIDRKINMLKMHVFKMFVIILFRFDSNLIHSKNIQIQKMYK